MKYLFICYPKCTTCQKARQWLLEHQIDFEERHIVENRPQAEELRLWIKKSGRPVKSFVNTSGLLYKSMNLKEKLPQMSLEEQLTLLASDGMLVKRPLLIGQDQIFSGFKPELWQQLL